MDEEGHGLIFSALSTHDEISKAQCLHRGMPTQQALLHPLQTLTSRVWPHRQRSLWHDCLQASMAGAELARGLQ